jgi:hypothetical protein
MPITQPIDYKMIFIIFIFLCGKKTIRIDYMQQ